MSVQGSQDKFFDWEGGTGNIFLDHLNVFTQLSYCTLENITGADFSGCSDVSYLPLLLLQLSPGDAGTGVAPELLLPYCSCREKL